MSYNTDLQNNNTSLQEILATVNSLPEAGGSSGGGTEIETCTIDIVATGAIQCRIYYSTLVNGEIKGQFALCDITDDSPLSIANVIVGATFGIKQVSSAYIMSIRAKNMETTFQPNGVSSTDNNYIDVTSYTDNQNTSGCLFINPMPNSGVPSIQYFVD